MPDPFRNYEGVPLIDLPADPPSPGIPALDVLMGQSGTDESADWIAFLSRLLFYAASISAAKQAPSGMRYALRVNPSSGNLHPTEFHLACPAGLFHYRVGSHMLEQRAAGDFGPLQFLIASIVWREAWKYQSRAYRYCLHDAGHAWQCLTLAAEAMGCEAHAAGGFDDDRAAELFGLPEDEWPLLRIGIEGGPVFPRAQKQEWFGGVPNQLSSEVIRYPLIEAIHGATKGWRANAGSRRRAPGPLSGAVESTASFGEVARRRRSALDFRGGSEGIRIEQLQTLLAAATRPLDADFAVESYVQLYLYVHRVEGLASGVYRHWPEDARLELLKTGDQRVMAAALSLGQDLAGNSCVTFSMIGDLGRAAAAHGDRGYRYVHFEAGAIGQRLYIGAEALGLQSTGIGAFFDDSVHQYLNIGADSGEQVVYHFACGYAVDDDRLVAKDRELLDLN